MQTGKKVSAEPVAVDVNPQEIKITWLDQHVSEFPIGYLRAACQCAACVSEITGQPLLDKGKIPENIHLVSAEPTGNYGVTFKFSDHHNTGIYSYEYMRQICPCALCQDRS